MGRLTTVDIRRLPEPIKKPLRRTRRLSYKSSLWARGWAKDAGATDATQNVYYATMQRSGSQWVKEIFSDPRIERHTQLKTYPQHIYEFGEFKRRFPLYTFVPGLYMSYDLYEEIAKPSRYRTFFVTRDPRNIVVSWYWSSLESHGLIGKVPRYRRDLQAMDLREGLHYGIRELSIKFIGMRTWVHHADDPNVLLLRFEDLTRDPRGCFGRIMTHCELPVPPDTLGAVLDDYTREKMRKRDLAVRQAKEWNVDSSHYRERPSRFEDAFEPEHHDHFRRVTGDLLEVLGYEDP